MANSSTPGASSGTKGSKRARTRGALIEAASALVREIGYERTSLEEVAARAGMTRGAIYGNFRNKEELFLAVAAARWEPILPDLRPGAPLREHLCAIGEALIKALPGRRAAAIGAASFQLYALTHPALQAQIAAANAGIYALTAARLREIVPEAELPVPAEAFVRILHALIDGISLLHALTPDLVGDAEIRAAFLALAPQEPGTAARS
jgi:AcrR family transcriptional regulator